MGVQANVVAGAVHEVLFIGRFVRVLVLYVCLVQQAQAQELRGHQLAHLFVVFRPERAGHQHFGGLLLDVQNSVVHLFLPVRKAAAHRDGPRHVAGIIGVFGPHVHQDELPFPALVFVLYVVQHVSAVARGDNGRIGKAAGAVPDEFVQEFRLDLELPDAGFYEAEHPAEALFGNPASGLHQVDFLGFLDSPDLLQDRVALGHLVGREFPFGRVDEPVFPGLGFHGLPVVFVGVEVDGVRLGHQVKKHLVKVLEPVHCADTRSGEGPVLGEFFAFPDGDVVVGLPQKEDFPVFRVDGVREQQQDGFLLVHPGEVEDVRGLAEGHRAVRPDGVYVVGVKNGQAAGLHLRHKLLAVPGEKPGIDRVVLHRYFRFAQR